MPAAYAATSPTVVVIGAPGLTWDDIDPVRTPALWALADRAALGSLVVRGIGPRTCPTEGWLTLGTGRRSAAGSRIGCASATVTGNRVEGWDELVLANRSEAYAARPGLLHDLLKSHGIRTLAVGAGAALAVADSRGQVPDYADSLPARLPTGLTVVDAGVAGTTDAGRADAVIKATLAAAPPDATIVVAGLADLSRTDDAHLRLALLAEPGGGRRWLASDSTRRPQLSAAPDLFATVLTAAGVPLPADTVGQPARARGARPATRPSVAELAGYDAKVRTVAASRKNFFTVLIASQLLLYLLGAVVLLRAWGGRRTRRRVLAGLRWAAVAFASVPVATFAANLVPWWRSEFPGLVVAALVGSLAVVLAAACLPWRRVLVAPIAIVGGLTFAVLVVDMLLGGRLEEASLMGYFPTDGGRFYGFGNVAFALLATSALLVSTAASARLRPAAALTAVAAVGAIAVAVDGAPFWGADVGGVLALVPGFLVLAMGVLGIALSWRRVVGALAAGVLLLVVVGLADWQGLLGGRTHLGRFVQQLIDGEGTTVLMRKARANGRILLTWLGLVVPCGIAFVALVLRRPGSGRAGALDRLIAQEPRLRPGAIALALTMAVGFAVNDSGIAIPAVSIVLAVPLVLAASVGALQADDSEGAKATVSTGSHGPPR